MLANQTHNNVSVLRSEICIFMSVRLFVSLCSAS